MSATVLVALVSVDRMRRRRLPTSLLNNDMACLAISRSVGKFSHGHDSKHPDAARAGTLVPHELAPPLALQPCHAPLGK
ncbi:hypothetical protein Sfulv_43020 [Streptomyces fulvorobeus]|uniref:Uncharacterized protein n=1 Tax=Streptomyces fulvorobeus TaxID=284028 RepID=A0A7J0CAH0_9ACTN|nr:hypothetical protein Sfulv_43020 [Streptomyces fulvorobeus]